MFDRIFDFLATVWESLLPFVVIDQYEAGVVLRWGKYSRTLLPGFCWMWPLIEACKYETVVLQTSYLDVQSLTSLEGKSVAISGIITYRITDIRKYLLDIDEGEDVVHNIVYGAISNAVEEYNWEDILTSDFNYEVFSGASKICSNRAGVKLIELTWSDKSIARNLRLWND